MKRYIFKILMDCETCGVEINTHQAKDNEWEAVENGCTCNIGQCSPDDNYKGCYDETQIRILEALFDKVHLIKQAMEYFEMEIMKHE